ncbi:MAG: DUF1638 domain-containing protein [Deltaproteobacteria bacterium]|nr:DUF1638 domain-containing protein [Deltaproteobacteria bacterium]
MREKRVLIACGIFDEELKGALESLEDAYEVSVIRLPPGYHCVIEELEAKLKEALEDGRIGDRSQARLLIGSNCLPDMRGFCSREGVKCLPTANCLSAMVGDSRLKELEDGKTMVITPAWIRSMFLDPDGIPSFMRWDAADFRMNFGRYDRMLVLGTGTPPTDEEILECFDLFGNPVFETEPCGPDHFNSLVRDFLA